MRRHKPLRGSGPSLTHPHMRGIVGLWALNEGTGSSLFDLSRNGRSGTLTSMDPATDWVAGPHGHSLTFDGVDDWVSFGSSWNALLNSGAFSISIWFEVGSAPGTSKFMHIVAVSNNWGASAEYIAIGTTGTGNAIKVLSNGETAGNGADLSAGWHHGVLTWDNSQFSMYVDGLLDYSVTPSGSDWKLGAELGVARKGVSNASHFYHDARVSDLRVYDVCLLADQVAEMYRDPYAAWGGESPVPAFVPLAGGAISGTVSESLVITSGESGIGTLVGSTSESLVVTDSESGILAAQGSVSDTLYVSTAESGSGGSESQTSKGGWAVGQRRANALRRAIKEDDEIVIALISRLLH